MELHFDIPACWHLGTGNGLAKQEPSRLSLHCKKQKGEVAICGQKGLFSTGTHSGRNPTTQAIHTAQPLPLPAHWMDSGPGTHQNSHSNRGCIKWQNFTNGTEMPNSQCWSHPLCHGHSPLSISSHAGLVTTGFQEQRINVSNETFFLGVCSPSGKASFLIPKTPSLFQRANKLKDSLLVHRKHVKSCQHRLEPILLKYQQHISPWYYQKFCFPS